MISEDAKRRPESLSACSSYWTNPGSGSRTKRAVWPNCRLSLKKAAIKGQGRIWIIVTTHGDMGSIFKEARALEGDMKKIEGRFRFKFGLTTENIELVLEDRLFKKVVAGKHQLETGIFESWRHAARTGRAC